MKGELETRIREQFNKAATTKLMKEADEWAKTPLPLQNNPEFLKEQRRLTKEFTKAMDSKLENIIVDIVDDARKEFPKFKDFTHEPPDDLTPEDFLNADILKFADFYGYITALKEWFEKWFGSDKE